MASNMPYVQVAAFCERFTVKPNRGITITKLIDTLFAWPAPAKGQFVITPVSAVFGFKSQPGLSKRTVRLFINTPSGIRRPLLTFDVNFAGNEKGPIAAMRMDLPVREEGVYWIDVTTGGVTLTRMPLRVVFQEP